MKSRCVVVVQYRPLEDLPPVMTLLTLLKRMGENVFFVGVETPAGSTFLQANDIEHEFLTPCKKGKIARALSFFPRRRQLLVILKKLKVRYANIVPWFQECHSAALAGDGVYRFGRPIVTFFEYECNYGENWIGFSLEHLFREGVIVESERNRAEMTQKNHQLHDTPLVIANKAEVDFSKVPPLSAEAEKVFREIGTRPVFMYQGRYGKERKHVPFILETIAKNRPDYCVLALPGEDVVEKLLAPYPNAFTLPRIPAPGHLAVTARATVGIATYYSEGDSPWALNAQYCAPNKIYEYAAFGVPTLGNKIPGLESTIGEANAGILCDMTEEAVLSAADQLARNIDQYRANAKRFYEGTDVESQIKAVLERSEMSVPWSESRS